MTFNRKYKFQASILLIAFISLLTQNIIWVSSVYAGSSGKDQLKKGIQEYENANFENAIQQLEQAIQKGLEGKEEQTDAYKHLAFSYAATGNAQKAKAMFLNLLQVDPAFELSITESPRLRVPFEQAKAEFVPKDTNPPIIEMTLPENVAENTAIELTAKVTDASGIASVIAFYKKATESRFNRLALRNTTGDFFSATIQAEIVTAGELLLYIEAKDNANNPPAMKGSANNPLKISVEMVDDAPPSITHTPITNAQENKALQIAATVTDRSGVDEVVLFFKNKDARKFNQIKMKESGNNRFICEIPENEVTAPGLAYFIQATDKKNGQETTKGTEAKPFVVIVTKSDQQPPQIVHKAVEEATAGKDIVINAEVTDNVGISTVMFNYRLKGDKKYKSQKMDKKQNDRYEAKLEAKTPGIEYYLEATDVSGNAPSLWKTPEKPQLITIRQPEQVAEVSKKGSKKWLWIGLGTIAIGGGAIVAVSSGGGSDDPVPGTPSTGDSRLPDPPVGP